MIYNSNKFLIRCDYGFYNSIVQPISMEKYNYIYNAFVIQY